VDAMYTIKEADPYGVGSENLFPFGGGLGEAPNTKYLLNAFGYIGYSDQYGMYPVLRDGELVIPAYDMEVFGEYLKLMNQFYNDGIINSNFVVHTGSEAIAQVQGGQTAVYCSPLYTMNLPSFTDWTAGYPLTSEWQTEPEWPTPTACDAGAFVVSADTEYPELCLRFADLYFNNETDNCRELWDGPSENSADTYGFVYRYYDEETGTVTDGGVYPEGTGVYWCEYISPFWPHFGAMSMPESAKKSFDDVAQGRAEFADPTDPESYPLTDGTAAQRDMRTRMDNVMPYAVSALPNVWYANDEEDLRIAELELMVTPHIQENVARFIVGDRPLSELADFVAELEKLGVQELLDLYKKGFGM